MSLSTSLASVGRALAYYPELSKFFGSVNASIFFAQLHYWQQRCSSDELGVYKTATEWQDETGLSYREQATARKMLVASGFLSEKYKRLQHRVYYQLNLPAVDAAFEAWTKAQFPNDENAIRETTKEQSGKSAKRSSGNAENATGGPTKAQVVNKTEITSKTTTETTSKDATSGAHAPADPMVVTAQNGTVYEIPAELRYPGPNTKSHKAWIAYAIAYQQRYGSWPIWNRTVSGQITQFIDRVGIELAPRVAVHYVRRVQEEFIVKQMHSVGMLLQSAEKWATQYQTGTTMTNTQARQTDQSTANYDAIEETKRMLRKGGSSNDSGVIDA